MDGWTEGCSLITLGPLSLTQRHFPVRLRSCVYSTENSQSFVLLIFMYRIVHADVQEEIHWWTLLFTIVQPNFFFIHQYDVDECVNRVRIERASLTARKLFSQWFFRISLVPILFSPCFAICIYFCYIEVIYQLEILKDRARAATFVRPTKTNVPTGC